MAKKANLSKSQKLLRAKRAEIDKLIEKAAITVRLPARMAVQIPIVRQPQPPMQNLLPTTAIPLPAPVARSQTIVVRLPTQPPLRTPLKINAVKFLALPGELRNKIYSYAFTPEFYQIGWAGKGQKRDPAVKTKKRSLTYCLPKRPGCKMPQLAPDACRRRRLLDLPRRLQSNEMIPEYRLSPGPAALLLTCKTVNEEASPWFYGNSTFTFECQGVFQDFMETIGKSSKEAIRSLHLKHYTAGNAFYRCNQEYKTKFDRKWENLCWGASDELTSLEELGIDLTINEVPLRFHPDERWRLTLTAFADLELKRCSVILRNATALDTVLEVETYSLRREMLGEDFVDGWRGECSWMRKREETSKGCKILKLTM